MGTLVAMPTLMPAAFAHVAMEETGVCKSGSMPMAPFFVFLPVARAVPEAAESVTPLSAENVDAMLCTGNRLMQSFSRPIVPFFSALNISVPSIVFTPVPSVIK